jgi:hypothetical protein
MHGMSGDKEVVKATLNFEYTLYKRILSIWGLIVSIIGEYHGILWTV